MGRNRSRGESIEQHSIDYVPPEERYGKPWHLFTVWFSSNVQITGFVTGVLAVTLGLDLPWAVATILIGNLVGAVFMAYHSIQGPRLGVPQMIQSRAQFGFLGTLLPVVIVLCMYVGFGVEGGVITGQAFANWAHISFTWSVIIQGAVPAVIAIVGYKVIHLSTRVVSVVSGLLFLALTIALACHLPEHLPSGPAPSFGTVLLVMSIFVSWQLTWAPYVSDYSRYLPEDTPSRTTFLWTYAGSALGSSWVMILGAFAATISAEAVGDDAIGMLSRQIPALSSAILLAIVIGIVPAGVYGYYGMYLTAISAFSAKGHGSATPLVRAVFIVVSATLTIAATLMASGHILSTVESITLFLLYLLVPWTAINLTDYYVVRRGHYDVGELFRPRGEYGLVNWPAVLVYLVAIAAQIPFISSSLYTGPLVDHLGGADISWIVGLLVATVLYLAYTRRTREVAQPVGARASAPGSDAPLSVD
ncbi:cytosine permease [Streptomyces sp. NBC_01669]|uniref:purine-cytosine permease family protein n=1 Tax=Streptomyces sp. NBC_01669 TaxID=2975909 RepID=UPI0022590791|nr:cytosine permease [Streptomyces sp. NBC_01669]MCX4538002.1 cytosine permease [Streptomyces sp. NBC_01669]